MKFLKEKLNNFLRDIWEEMQDDFPNSRLRFLGALDMALHIELINLDEHELWLHRIKNCPDLEDDHAGRCWCAYCGDIEVNENQN